MFSFKEDLGADFAVQGEACFDGQVEALFIEYWQGAGECDVEEGGDMILFVILGTRHV